MARSRTETKTVVLKQWVIRLSVRGILRIVSAGILVAALVVIITGDINDSPDAERTPESNGKFVARVSIVTSTVQ